jgi:hypothetical protein
MRRLIVSLSVAIVMLLLLGCPNPTSDGPSQGDTTEDGSTGDNSSDGDTSGIYIAGFYTDVDATGDPTVATYWVYNGGTAERHDLTDGVPTDADARATDVFVDGSNVYVSGYYVDASNRSWAVLWKNGTATPLSNDTEDVQATGVHVSDGVVYVSGTIIASTSDGIPVLWEDGARTELLSAAAQDGAGNGLAVDPAAATVVVAGEYRDGVAAAYAAKLWNGAGNEIDVSNGDVSEALDVDVGSDGNYYVAGSFFDSDRFPSAYWVFDSATSTSTRTDLTRPGGSNQISKAFGIDEEGGTVYTAGFYPEGTVGTAAYWTDQTRTTLSSGLEGRAMDIMVIEGTSNSVGYHVSSGTREAILWQGTTAIVLSDQIAGDAEAHGVFSTTP